MAQVKEVSDEARDIAEDTVNNAHHYINKAKNQAQEISGKVNRYAKEKPWYIAGAGLLAGLVIGLLISNKRK